MCFSAEASFTAAAVILPAGALTLRRAYRTDRRYVPIACHILHHLKHFVSDARNAVLFTGFQAGSTRGAAMTGGATTVKIHGSHIPVRAEIENLHMLSAHADADERGYYLQYRPPSIQRN